MSSAPSLTIPCATEAETKSVGRSLAALLRPGDVLVLEGPLGAGKTALVSGIGDGLGIPEPVTSPTFLLMRRYDSGFLPLVHVDAYRMASLGEFADLEAVAEAADGALAVEWGDMVITGLPAERLRITIDGQGAAPRMITLHPSGDWVDRDLGMLA